MASSRSPTLGDVLRRSRLAAGLTQEQLAERSGLSVRGISDLERGLKLRPRKETIALLAAALGLTESERTLLASTSRRLTGDVQETAPLLARSWDGPPRHNLPLQPTSFVGRKGEIASISERLDEVRLLTLTGPGGVGKTRLVLEVARGLLKRYRDGVWFVDLAPVRDPALVPGAVARTLGIRDAGDQPLLDTLRLYLQPRSTLLLLDNFEQVIGAAPLLADLLTFCHRLKILVTSRQRLRLRGEQVWPVSPLALPDTDADPAEIGRAPAVALFVARAQARHPAFQLQATNALLVAAVCARLDGLPLAIELAAAWVELLPLGAIQARLEHSLDLLNAGPRDAPVRQHTLRAAIAWSYGLLDAAEQTTFRHLAVFPGGFTIEAAEVVCTREDLLARLSSLLDKNLIRSDARGDEAQGEARFRLLDTIREFGLEQLAASGELHDVQKRFARYFLALAEEGHLSLRARVQRIWLDRLEAEHANLQGVLDWSVSQPDRLELGARLSGALCEFWSFHGHFASGRAWYERVLARAEGANLPAALRVTLLWTAAYLALRASDYVAATRFGDQGIALGERAAGSCDLAYCLAMRGLVACRQSHFALARATFERGLGVARQQGDPRAVAMTLGFSGILAYLEGDYPRACALSEECLRWFRQQGEAWGIAMNLDTLGAVARQHGQYHRAQALHQESLAASQEIGDQAGVARSLANLGHVARAQGDSASATLGYAESLRIAREIGDRSFAAMALGNLGVLAERAGDLALAQAQLEESLTLGRAVGDPRLIAAALRELAPLSLLQGDLSAAVAHCVESLHLYGGLRDRRGLARILEVGIRLVRAEGRSAAAAELATLAEAVGKSHDSAEGSAPLPSDAPSPELASLVTRSLALLEPTPGVPRPKSSLAATPTSPLSRRESEVALLVARGLTNRAIATELVIGERTIDTHVSSILDKLGLETRAQIAVWVVQRGGSGKGTPTVPSESGTLLPG